jgi:hypothetical protein
VFFIEKKFNTVLSVPRVWKSLLEIESFDDLTAFLERRPPPESVGLQGLTQPEWPRPIQHDRREVSFVEDGYTVCLGLISGDERYFALPSVVFPTGERYAHQEAGLEVSPEEILEIEEKAKFSWRQRLV